MHKNKKNNIRRARICLAVGGVKWGISAGEATGYAPFSRALFEGVSRE